MAHIFSASPTLPSSVEEDDGDAKDDQVIEAKHWSLLWNPSSGHHRMRPIKFGTYSPCISAHTLYHYNVLCSVLIFVVTKSSVLCLCMHKLDDVLERIYGNRLYMPTLCFVTHVCGPINLEIHTTLFSPMNMYHVIFVGKHRFPNKKGVFYGSTVFFGLCLNDANNLEFKHQ